MTPDPAPIPESVEGSTLRSVRWKTDVFNDALDLADRMNWSFSFLANFALRDYLCRDQASAGEPPDLTTWAENGWKVMDENGSCGKGYELSLTFSLPNMGDADQTCYEIRERLISALSEAGGRDVVTRLVALGSMMAERRGDATHDPNCLCDECMADYRPMAVTGRSDDPARAKLHRWLAMNPTAANTSVGP